jgi:hypothetical protein
MESRAIKMYEVEEGSTQNMWYSIHVYEYVEGNRTLVGEFTKPTMREAIMDCQKAGFKFIHEFVQPKTLENLVWTR